MQKEQERLCSSGLDETRSTIQLAINSTSHAIVDRHEPTVDTQCLCRSEICFCVSWQGEVGISPSQYQTPVCKPFPMPPGCKVFQIATQTYHALSAPYAIYTFARYIRGIGKPIDALNLCCALGTSCPKSVVGVEHRPISCLFYMYFRVRFIQRKYLPGIASSKCLGLSPVVALVTLNLALGCFWWPREVYSRMILSPIFNKCMIIRIRYAVLVSYCRGPVLHPCQLPSSYRRPCVGLIWQRLDS